ncbi:glycine/D-amino acid oxidase-like deaminating enzyme [Streptomyces sp. SAI-135]|uniref:protoporphyrinogen/coproporphyrinogen oxidase n=1 Tax=unclassified Streptomyces TaxID=2593676 RepID=UPI0024755B1B|nr:MULTISPECIES: FAD-dependent oxidoreductase [unclassified Streptomyces]MDH6515061.1 glycine/D-amino acid oxidase-like deaminating enzyme [Streptomyces sp. SAI-090]MDH6620855.1 glycine/D-amino acid oxidase-like deaminating enzyme [Streptomyces sp. SAI-135]
MQELPDRTGPRTVAVVGAGPSGLAVARELERAGHRVTVLEEQDTVAGKCQSVHVDGHAFDLGGHICTNRYARVAELLGELDVETERTSRYRVLDARGRAVRQPMAFLRDGSLQRYRALREREFPRIAEPGLAHSARALAAPVGRWIADHGLYSMAESFGTGYTAAGYGHLDDDVPALYFVKYAEMTGLLDPGPELLGHPGDFTVVGGFATLWRRVAQELKDVRCGVRVTSVERRPDGVRLHTDSGPVAADEVVLAVALDRILPVLDATDEERDLAARIRSNAYHTTLAAASGLPSDAFYFLAAHTTSRETAGHCVSYHHRYPGSEVRTFYSYGRPGEVTALLSEDVAALGGRLEEVHLRREWAFMPHFGGADLRDGALDRLDALQGQDRTYFVGGLPAFELVECTVAHAQDLARRHFPPAQGTLTRRDDGPATIEEERQT